MGWKEEEGKGGDGRKRKKRRELMDGWLEAKREEPKLRFVLFVLINQLT